MHNVRFLKRNWKQIKSLKEQGHKIISSLVRSGLLRDDVYIELARRLNCMEENAHFQKMYTEKQVMNAVNKLIDMRDEFHKKRAEERKAKRLAQIQEPIPTKKVESRRSNTLPILEQKRILATHNPILPQTPWWKRLLRRLRWYN